MSIQYKSLPLETDQGKHLYRLSINVKKFRIFYRVEFTSPVRVQRFIFVLTTSTNAHRERERERQGTEKERKFRIQVTGTCILKPKEDSFH